MRKKDGETVFKNIKSVIFIAIFILIALIILFLALNLLVILIPIILLAVALSFIIKIFKRKKAVRKKQESYVDVEYKVKK